MLAKIPHIIGFIQLIHGGRKRTRLLVIKLDRPNILLRAMGGFNLALTLQVFSHRRCGNGESEQQQKNRNRQPKKEITLFSGRVLALACHVRIYWTVRGSRWVLLFCRSVTSTELGPIDFNW